MCFIFIRMLTFLKVGNICRKALFIYHYITYIFLLLTTSYVSKVIWLHLWIHFILHFLEFVLGSNIIRMDIVSWAFSHYELKNVFVLFIGFSDFFAIIWLITNHLLLAQFIVFNLIRWWWSHLVHQSASLWYVKLLSFTICLLLNMKLSHLSNFILRPFWHWKAQFLILMRILHSIVIGRLTSIDMIALETKPCSWWWLIRLVVLITDWRFDQEWCLLLQFAIWRQKLVAFVIFGQLFREGVSFFFDDVYLCLKSLMSWLLEQEAFSNWTWLIGSIILVAEAGVWLIRLSLVGGAQGVFH